jgi:hypothetical protein
MLTTSVIVENALLRICIDCGLELAVGQSFAVEANRMILRLTIDPLGGVPPIPDTECEAECLAVVRELAKDGSRRVVTSEILTRLAMDNNWARSTITNALASLTHKGLLINRHDRKGYGLPIGKDGCLRLASPKEEQ